MSDYKRGDDISSHPPPLCVCLFWLRNLPSLSFPFWYVFSDDKRGDDISSHPPPLCVCLFWLPLGCWKHGGDLEKDLAALVVRLRSQRNVRVRFYYIHFKELESRYMSHYSGNIGRIPHNDTYTGNDMHHDVYFVLSRSESAGKTYCGICGLGTCGWFYDVFDAINLIYNTVIRRWVYGSVFRHWGICVVYTCRLVSLDILCVSSDHNIHTEHFSMSRCHASRRTCFFCDTKRLCICTAHSSWLSF